METTSYVYKEGATPNTRAVVSSKNKIWAPAAAQNQLVQIGVMTTFGTSESRAVDPLRGVGYGDQVAEMVPSATEPIAISVERTMLYLANMFQVFGYEGGIDGMVRSLKHHRWPFDIKQEIVFSELVNNEFPTAKRLGPTLPLATGSRAARSGIFALVTYYEACWINDHSVDYPSEGTAVAENVSIVASDVYDPNADGEYDETLNGGNNPFNDQLGSDRFPTT